MSKLYFEVKLLSDIIINEKAATEGPNSTLDFIPGNNFLGIAASKFYADIKSKKENVEDVKLLEQQAWTLFHSGQVRFGDAHLGENGKRANKVPAAMFYPKLSKPSEKLYISHLIPENENVQGVVRNEQLKQCRNGFYLFVDNSFKPVTVDRTFAIKSAHDRKTRTSKEAQLFGYESMNTNQVLYFEVECGDEHVEVIKSLLTGIKRVGRSRSAQYGLVNIKAMEEPYAQVESTTKSGTVAIYADSRLIFIDEETGLPTFRPTEKQLGLSSGEISWEKSQIRTFQYAPWNFTRQCFDTDRCGLEKGSVIVVENVSDCPSESQYVGSYVNEGFGKVIYNPSFLEGDRKTGLAHGHLMEHGYYNVSIEPEGYLDEDSLLVTYLKDRYFNECDEQSILELVDDWIQNNSLLFKGDSFASQWGEIRNIASQNKEAKIIKKLLYDNVQESNRKDMAGNVKTEKQQMGYLVHGVAKDKWKGARLDAFRKFCDIELQEFQDKFFRMAIINLAAQMAKKCRKENLR